MGMFGKLKKAAIAGLAGVYLLLNSCASVPFDYKSFRKELTVDEYVRSSCEQGAKSDLGLFLLTGAASASFCIKKEYFPAAGFGYVSLYFLWNAGDKIFNCHKIDRNNPNLIKIVEEENKKRRENFNYEMMKKIENEEKERSRINELLSQQKRAGDEFTKYGLITLGCAALGTGLVIYANSNYCNDENARNNIYYAAIIPLIISMGSGYATIESGLQYLDLSAKINAIKF